MRFSIIDHNGRHSIAAFVEGELMTATDDHWNWENIKAAVENGTATIEMFNPVKVITKYLQLSSRFAVRNDVITYDDDPIDNSVADKIIEFIKDGIEIGPLVQFMKNLYENPSENSRRELYDWIGASNLAISDDGSFIAYKYLYRAGDKLRSGASGFAYVNGEEQTGLIYQSVGDVVTMPRSQVNDDSSQTCSFGLHVGAWSYVAGLGDEVHVVYVNPRDVVSVPDDYGNTKMRVCRYVLGPRVDHEIVDHLAKALPNDEVYHFNSSFVEKAEYSPDTGDLVVWLHGNPYNYVVSRQVWEEFINAESPGTYYNNFIRWNLTAAA